MVTAGRTTPTDLIVDDTDQVVINNAHLGVGAEASRAADKWKPRLGKLGYALGAMSAGYDPQFVRVTVTVDGREVARRRRVAQVAIGNGSNVGGGTELIPGADPADGELVVIVSRARGMVRRFTYVARLRRGKHHLMKEVDRASGRTVVVVGEPFYVITDGEISDQACPRRSWELRAGAVRMYLPERPASGATASGSRAAPPAGRRSAAVTRGYGRWTRGVPRAKRPQACPRRPQEGPRNNPQARRPLSMSPAGRHRGAESWRRPQDAVA